LQGIAADQKAEAARLLSLAKAKGFNTWEAACEADRIKWEAVQQAEEAEAKRRVYDIGAEREKNGVAVRRRTRHLAAFLRRVARDCDANVD
jgi:hypothetical protein